MNSLTLNSIRQANKNPAIAMLGLVFGTIGTSPMYAMKVAFGGSRALEPSPDNILGILSLIFWAIMLIVSLKYAAFMLRVDNKGEGGIMALMSLMLPNGNTNPRSSRILIALGLAGTSLVYANSIYTPAIAMLSSVEGLAVLEPGLDRFVLPISLGTLIVLLGIQRKGTTRLGAWSGPVMLAWFGSLAAFGLLGLSQAPIVLAAIDPGHAVHFLATHQAQALFALCAVVLAISGGEAMYTHIGQFGRDPIQKTWFVLVLPSLLANYFGQGALLLHDPAAARNPFFLLIPHGGLAAMIVLAILASLVTSQAVISGAFSLTSQAIRLSFCPRLNLNYTSEEEIGQIHIPWVNRALMIGIGCLVLGFPSSLDLAAGYGMVVSGTLVIDTVLALMVMHGLWHWRSWMSASLALAFAALDAAFLTASATKIPDGGWLAPLIGLMVFYLLSTWKRGRDLLLEKTRRESMPTEKFLAFITGHPPSRVPGTAVFMTSGQEGIPPALIRNLKHNKMLHETVILMTVLTENVPRVAPDKRREVTRLADGIFRIVVHYGFKETPNVSRVLKSISRDVRINLADTTFFLGRQTLIPSKSPEITLTRLRLFIGMARNTPSVASFFHIPPDRVVEIGVQIVV